jgi:hypothetical protein
MNTTGKWLARAGGLLLLVGFFLPAASVSCSGTKTPYSLFGAAGQNGGIAIFLVLVFALALVGLTFLPARKRMVSILLIIGQLAVLAISVLVIGIVLIFLYGQAAQVQDIPALFTGFDLTPYQPTIAYGSILLLLGFLVAGAGAILQFFLGKSATVTSVEPPGGTPPGVQPPPLPVADVPIPQVIQTEPSAGTPPVVPQVAVMPKQNVPTARLEIIKGAAHPPVIVTDNFIIGRGSACHLQLQDTTVSRQHVRLRFASGAWFLQDVNSTSGTFVNRRKVQAIRINPGDEITIGATTMIFRS